MSINTFQAFNPMFCDSFFFRSPGFGAFRTLRIWIDFQSLKLRMMMNLLIAMDPGPALALPMVHLNRQELAISKCNGSYKATCQGNISKFWGLVPNTYIPQPSCHPCLGIQVCREAWLQILGVGRDRLARCKKNFRGTDLRSLGCFVWN